MPSPPRVIRLLQRIVAGDVAPCSFDQLLAVMLSGDDKDIRRRVAASVELREVQALVDCALRGSGEERKSADLALMSYRNMLAAEDAQKREAAINEGRKLLARIDSARYPRTSALTNLKIGTSLAAMSAGKPARETKLLTQAIESLNSALRGLSNADSAQERYLALYNLVLAHGNLWKTSGDWDGADHLERALAHGEEALELIDALKIPPDRTDTIMQALLELAFSKGDGALSDPRTRKIVIAVLERMLKGKGARRMKADRRDALEVLLAEAQTFDMPAGRGRR